MLRMLCSHLTIPCVGDVFPWQAQEEMAWRIAKMIVNDVMQQAHCEQRSEKGTKVRGGRMHASDWPEPRCGRSRALACFPGASECTLPGVQTCMV